MIQPQAQFDFVDLTISKISLDLGDVVTIERALPGNATNDQVTWEVVNTLTYDTAADQVDKTAAIETTIGIRFQLSLILVGGGEGGWRIRKYIRTRK